METMSRTLFVAGLSLMAISTVALAATPRVNTNTATCASVQQSLVANGAAILRYPSPRDASRTLYDRYVSDSRYCPTGEIGQWASVPTTSGACRVIACEPRLQVDPLFPNLVPRLRLSVGD